MVIEKWQIILQMQLSPCVKFYSSSLQNLQNKGFLEVINKYVEVHATVGGGVSILKKEVWTQIA